MISEIVPNLFIGAWPDQNLFNGGILNVIEQPPQREHSVWVPILLPDSWLDYDDMGIDLNTVDLDRAKRTIQTHERTRTIRADIGALKLCARIIGRFQSQNRRLLVHCGGGIERAPLAVAFWLVSSHYCRTFDEAYNLLSAARPIVLDRRVWLPSRSVWRMRY